MINIACWIQFKRDITIALMYVHEFLVRLKCLCAFSNFPNKVSYTFFIVLNNYLSASYIDLFSLLRRNVFEECLDNTS